MKTLMSPYSIGCLDGAGCHRRAMGWEVCWHALHVPWVSLASALVL